MHVQPHQIICSRGRMTSPSHIRDHVPPHQFISIKSQAGPLPLYGKGDVIPPFGFGRTRRRRFGNTRPLLAPWSWTTPHYRTRLPDRAPRQEDPGTWDLPPVQNFQPFFITTIARDSTGLRHGGDLQAFSSRRLKPVGGCWYI